MKSKIITQLEGIGLLSRGKALDAGAMHGRESIALAEKGFEVDSVDLNTAKIKEAVDGTPKDIQDKINIREGNIGNIDLPNNSYDVIIAKNVLPFLANKGPETLQKLLDSIKGSGVIYFTVFGDKHSWKDKKSLWFVDAKEKQGVEELLKKSGFEVKYYSEEIGLVQTMDGQPTPWHSYEYICQRV